MQRPPACRCPGSAAAGVARAPPIERLVRGLRRLPGIGEKSATRLAFFLLLGARRRWSRSSASCDRAAQAEIVLCEECFDLTDTCPVRDLPRRAARRQRACAWSRSPGRRGRSSAAAATAGTITCSAARCRPIDGIGPDELRIAELVARVRRGGIREVDPRDQSQRRRRRHGPLRRRAAAAARRAPHPHRLRHAARRRSRVRRPGHDRSLSQNRRELEMRSGATAAPPARPRDRRNESARIASHRPDAVPAYAAPGSDC